MRGTEFTLRVLEGIEEDSFALPKVHEEQRGMDLPALMDDVSDAELGNYLGMFASMYSRARFELAKAESDIIALSSRKKWAVAKHMAQMPPKVTVTAWKAQIEAREEIRSLSEQKDEAEINQKLLQALVDGYKKKFDAVSREVGRRGTERKAWDSKRNTHGHVATEDSNGEEKSWSL